MSCVAQHVGGHPSANERKKQKEAPGIKPEASNPKTLLLLFLELGVDYVVAGSGRSAGRLSILFRNVGRALSG